MTHTELAMSLMGNMDTRLLVHLVSVTEMTSDYVHSK
jgi:hypothetical protein